MEKLFLYNVSYIEHEEELCNLEIRSLFRKEPVQRVFISDRRVNPAISPFIRNRLEITYRAETFQELLSIIEKEEISLDGFKVRYLSLSKEDSFYEKRKQLCTEVGLRIEGLPLYKNAKVTLGLCYHSGYWYLGYLLKNSNEWRKHNKKPHAYSSSIAINIAKVLVNVAGEGDFTTKIIDPCCGVGTVLLEGNYAGYDICGCEIKEKVCEKAIKNLQHFSYDAKVRCGDIRDIEDYYDSAIVDMPYNIFSKTSEENEISIIKNAKRIAKKIILVTSKDMRELIEGLDLKVLDGCKIGKGTSGRDFYRYIWVCE